MNFKIISCFLFQFISDDEPSPVATDVTQFSTPLMTAMAGRTADLNASSSSSDEESQPQKASKTSTDKESEVVKPKDNDELKAEKKFEKLEKSDSAIDDVTMSPEEK